MTIVFAFLKDKGFAAGDTETGRTDYAYPASPNAERARKNPAEVAKYMVEGANKFRMPPADTDLGLSLRMRDLRLMSEIQAELQNPKGRNRGIAVLIGTIKWLLVALAVVVVIGGAALVYVTNNDPTYFHRVSE